MRRKRKNRESPERNVKERHVREKRKSRRSGGEGRIKREIKDEGENRESVKRVRDRKEKRYRPLWGGPLKQEVQEDRRYAVWPG